MSHQLTSFSDALLAWETWSHTSFNNRRESLLSFKQAIKETMPTWSNILSYHLEHASKLLESPHNLIGPTGETNELYLVGRGVALIIQQDHGVKARQSVIAQLSVALIAGNSVILCSDDMELVQTLKTEYTNSRLPINVIQFVTFDTGLKLIKLDVRSVSYVGNTTLERQINIQLAKRTGAIINLVSETDLDTIPMAHDPHLLLSFITERTRTINITAVGGNATLLELGSHAH